jgi:hypothetical protein|uniref:Uncharacterized protein n=1 Tax=Desulfomonile tiedjei TaxID=2358 RepID=A0A7C4ATI3_9BACT
MVYTDAQAWLEAHEFIECKALKGKWTKRTCLDISRGIRRTQRKYRSTHVEASPAVMSPCANCPIYATLEK